MRWGILPLLLLTLVLTTTCVLLRRFLPAPLSSRPVHPTPWARNLSMKAGRFIPAAAILVAGALTGVEIMRAIGSPESPSQTYDAVFHLNAVAHILDSGDASPLHMNLTVPDQKIVLYPTVWHATVSLVVMISGASIVAATNALSLVVAGMVWPVAILFFSEPFLRARRAHLLICAIFAANASAFPYLLLSWGVLYPNFLATALLPIALGFTHRALRPRDDTDKAPRVAVWIAVLSALGASALAHPNTAYGFTLIAAPLLLAYANDVRRSSLLTPAKIVRWAAVAASFGVFVTLWCVAALADNDKHYDGGFATGIVNALTNAPLVAARSWFITLFVLTGVALLCLRRRHRWLVASYAMLVIFYAIATGIDGPLRTALTGAWYNDAARLAALLPIVTVPLATVAAGLLLDLVSRGLTSFNLPPFANTKRKLLPLAALAAVCTMILAGSRSSNISAQTNWMHEVFSADPALQGGPQMLSEDELTLLHRLDETVPADAKIAGDPWNGSAYVYSISHRKAVFPHLTSSYGQDATLIAAELRTMGASACAPLERLDVDYVLDFGDPNFGVYPRQLNSQFSGLRDVSANPILREVDSEGNAVLYRIDCND
jgi:hypothetical protein